VKLLLHKALETERLILQPITVHHTRELVELFSDPKLHEFVPFEVPTFEEQEQRCARWSRGRSPDGSEIWLNWAARDRMSGKLMGHFQAGIKQDSEASIGYVMAREFHGKGFATEAMQAVLNCLRDQYKVKKVKAWSDTRNKASHKLAERLGMTIIETIKNADFFKGSISDEFVFAKDLK
jgi:ribosomal-protein-alanine N-acetyltransferase